MTISSVDSGNLAASFYTLRTGCRSMLREPLLDPALFAGIRDHWQLLTGLPMHRPAWKAWSRLRRTRTPIHGSPGLWPRWMRLSFPWLFPTERRGILVAC